MSNFTDQQLQAITTIDNNVAVSAGAGSGKTTVLIQRVYNLLTYIFLKQLHFLRIRFVLFYIHNLHLRMAQNSLHNTASIRDIISHREGRSICPSNREVNRLLSLPFHRDCKRRP